MWNAPEHPFLCGMVWFCVWSVYFLTTVITPGAQRPACMFCCLCAWKFKNIQPRGQHKSNCFVITCGLLIVYGFTWYSWRKCQGDAAGCNCRCSSVSRLSWKRDLLPACSFSYLFDSTFPTLPIGSWMAVHATYLGIGQAKLRITLMCLNLSLWHSHSHCFLLGFLFSTLFMWLGSSRRLVMRMLQGFRNFLF